jgi:hypothetical protein
MARKITWWAAAEIIGVSDRTMRRWRERLETHCGPQIFCPDIKGLILQGMAMCHPEYSCLPHHPTLRTQFTASGPFSKRCSTSVASLLLTARFRSSLAAENLFLRKQLALFQERQIKPRRATNSTRWLMVVLSRLFNWRTALVVVKPDTLIRWHRQGVRLLWRWKSKKVGRPRLPKDLQQLIRKMAAENPTWGEERVANELKLKLSIRVSPRTVQKYLAGGGHPDRKPDPSQRWLTFVRNHAQAIVACDFFIVVTARFRILYVFVLMELGRRRILHQNATSHPTAEWTLQQFREALPGDHPYRFVIHDQRQYLLKRTSRSRDGHGRACVANTGASTAGKRDV